MKKKRILGILLSFALMLTMMPMMSMPAYAEPETYNLWVGSTQVTEANKDNVLGDGKVSYTPSEDGKSGTLTLTNATINTATMQGNGTENIYYEDSDLKIVLNGNNTISTEGDPAKWAIRAVDNTDDGQDFGNLTIGGNGSLTVNGAEVALYSEGSIEIKGGRISATSEKEETIYVKNNVTISGGEVTANSWTDDAIYVWNGNVSINGGTVNVTGGSRGIYAKDSVTLNVGTVNAIGRSVGIYAYSSVTVNGGTVTAAGEESAIDGTVKNEIAGTGWTDVEGTQGETSIPVSNEGQSLKNYKKVHFSAVPNPPAEITVNTKTVSAESLRAAAAMAGASNDSVTTIVLGKKVKKIKKGAFKNYKNTKTLVVKTKKLKKASVRKSLKGSKIRKIKVSVGKKKTSKKYVKKYRKIFTKQNAGRKVKVSL